MHQGRTVSLGRAGRFAADSFIADRFPIGEVEIVVFQFICEKRHSFLNFPYVCPEPVWVK